MNIITIDFHNTLFVCDDWFQLEIRSLPSAVLRSVAQATGTEYTDDHVAEAMKIYREIREDAMRTGIECDADTSMLRILDLLGIEVSQDIVFQAVRQVMHDSVDEARPRDGAVELVRKLEARGQPMAVVSSAAYHPFLEWCLERYYMRSAFSCVVTSASCGIYKSNPEIYRHTLNLFGADASRSIHIGDSHRFDVTSASRIGMKTIFLTSEIDRPYDPAPDAIIESLGDAETHLDRLLGR
jgi:FMN phosphatase YigB (HAD superfamily)